jgi:hypothetical protein
MKFIITFIYTINNFVTNYSLSSSGNYNYGTLSVSNGNYELKTYCEDIYGNINNTESVNFTINVASSNNNGDGSSSDNSCNPLWSCSYWTICSNGIQLRSCEKINACYKNTNKPIEEKNCTLYSSLLENVGDATLGNIVTKLNCGIKPSIKDYSECSSSNTQSRINYECSIETNYEWISYTEVIDCSENLNWWQRIVKFLKSIWQWIISFLINIWKYISSFLISVWQWILDFFKKIWLWISNLF